VVVEVSGLRLRHLGACRPEQAVCLGVVEGQARRVDLEQLAAGPDRGEPEAGLDPPREHDLRADRDVCRQRDERVEAAALLEDVDVVQDEHDRVVPARERGTEAGQAAGPERVSGSGQRLEDHRPNRAVGGKRLGDVGQEDDRVVVPSVERDPGERPRIRAVPLAEHGRLSVPGRGEHAHEAAAARAGERLDEPRALDQPPAGDRRLELGREQLEGPPRTFSG
jgi:hypothetical protein